ncbi:MAG: hypothetical protein WCX27_01225, partial [Candidatus Paceibacterota bacterium]
MKRGVKPKNKVRIKWSSDFAYAIGLIATDGNLSPDGRHLCFTSKDIEQINNYQKALCIKCHIGRKSNGLQKEKKYYVIQFSDVNFYNFLLSIGITPAKSKTLGKIYVPSKYFFDFLRGCLDGDGTFYSYWDPRWRSSHMFYIEFVSASKKHVNWLRSELKNRIGVWGHITDDGEKLVCQLKYAKREAL